MKLYFCLFLFFGSLSPLWGLEDLEKDGVYSHFILHRNKKGTKYHYIRSFFPTEDLQSIVKSFEGKYILYDASLFSETNSHNWQANLKWLYKVLESFDKCVLTDLPIGNSNIRRTNGKAQFSAYLREIAFLLLEGFRPATDAYLEATNSCQVSQSGFVLVKESRIQLVDKKYLPRVLTDFEVNALEKIVNNKFYSMSKVKYILHCMGIPTELNSQEVVQLEEKYQRVAEQQEQLHLKNSEKQKIRDRWKEIEMASLDLEQLEAIYLAYCDNSLISATDLFNTTNKHFYNIWNLGIDSGIVPDFMGKKKVQKYLKRVIKDLAAKQK